MWVQLWTRCHELRQDGWHLRAWPDDGALIDQEELLIEIFTIVGEEKSKLLSEKLKKQSKQGGINV